MSASDFRWEDGGVLDERWIRSLHDEREHGDLGLGTSTASMA